MGLPNGTPGHPIHPPLRDATIGIYTAATVFSLLSVFGVSKMNNAAAWWLAFDGEVSTAGLMLTLAGYGLLALGGALGGTLVFVHGLRVLGTGDRSAAASPPAPPERR